MLEHQHIATPCNDFIALLFQYGKVRQELGRGVEAGENLGERDGGFVVGKGKGRGGGGGCAGDLEG